MAKRFTAAEKWDDPWFFELSAIQKLFWIFLLDKCDHAGIYRVNKPLMKVYLGHGDEGIDTAPFEGRIVYLTPDKWFIPKFIAFQYGTLSPDNRAHQSVINILKKEGLSKHLASPLEGAKDKEKDKEPSAVNADLSAFEMAFDQFWTAYPKKRSRGDALKAWRALKPSKELTERILRSLQVAKRSSDWVKDGGQFVPYPGTWLRAQGWEDDIRLPSDMPRMSSEDLAKAKAEAERRMNLEWERREKAKQMAVI